MIYHGGSVYLDTMDVTDIDDLRTWRNDYRVRQYCRQHDLLPKDAHSNWYQKQLAENRSEKMYAVCRRTDSKVVGVCGLTSIDLINRSAEFSLYIAPCFQKLGLGKSALETLFTHGFLTYGLNSIWGESYEHNPARKMFRSLGLKEDGVRRKAYFRDGLFIDAYLYSVLSDEWKTRCSC